MSKKTLKENIIIKANKYPLLLNSSQEKLLNSWMEQAKWIYNAFIQKRQYLIHLKKTNSSKYEDEYKKGFPKTDKGKVQFTWKTYWSCIYKELKRNYPDLNSLPSMCIESNTGVIADLYKAYEMMNDLERKKRKNKRKKKNRFHPEEKSFKDDISLGASVGLSEKEMAAGKKSSFSIVSTNSTARITGFPKINEAFESNHKDHKTLKILYPKKYRLPDVARVTHLRILKEGDKFYLYLTFQQKMESPTAKDDRPIVGIDLGTDNPHNKNCIALSNGTLKSRHDYDSFSLMEKLKEKKKRMQRKLRNKKGGNKNKKERQSNNYKKAYAKIAKIDERIAKTRQYHSKMMAQEIVQNHSVVVMEKLALSNMTKSAKGTIQEPGKNVKAKSGLNAAILDVAMYAFKQNVINKAKEFNTVVLQVDPRYTSQRCMHCGCVDSKNRNGIEFKCVSCNHEDHADINAAKNVELVGTSGMNKIDELKTSK